MLGFLGALLCLCVALQLAAAKSKVCMSLEQKCFFKGPAFLREGAGAYISEEFLDKHCSDVTEYIECQKNYLFVCSSESYKPFVDITKGASELMNELCNQTSELRAGYSLHVPCFRNSSDLFVSCTLNAVREMGGYSYNDGENENDTIMSRLCKFYDLFQSCTHSEIEQKCGTEGARFFNIILEKPVAQIRAEKCNSVAE